MLNFPWKPLNLKTDLEKRIEETFDQLIHKPWGRGILPGTWEPQIDIYETDDAYVIEADLPGVKAEDIKLHIDEHSVSISGKRQSASLVKSARGVSLERRYGSFSRTISLNKPIDPDQIEQSCEEGIYHVRLPKKK